MSWRDGDHNAIITSAVLSTEENGCLIPWVHLDYGDCSQGFGGHVLYNPEARHDVNFAGHFIFRVMQIAGVSDWQKLPGKCIRVRVVNGLIQSVGHIIKNDWFTPHADFIMMEGKDAN